MKDRDQILLEQAYRQFVLTESQMSDEQKREVYDVMYDDRPNKLTTIYDLVAGGKWSLDMFKYFIKLLSRDNRGEDDEGDSTMDDFRSQMNKARKKIANPAPLDKPRRGDSMDDFRSQMNKARKKIANPAPLDKPPR
jgi:hypothetical protein